MFAPDQRGSVLGSAMDAFERPKGVLNTIGVIADALARLGGAAPGYQSALDQRQQRSESLIDREIERQYKQAQIAKMSRPDTPEQTNTQRTYEYLRTVNPELATQWLTNQASAPPLVVPNADGTRTIYPGGAVPRSVPQAPVGRLTPMTGGASPSGSRTFPLR